jgi:hypothetical protein
MGKKCSDWWMSLLSGSIPAAAAIAVAYLSILPAIEQVEYLKRPNLVVVENIGNAKAINIDLRLGLYLIRSDDIVTVATEAFNPISDSTINLEKNKYLSKFDMDIRNKSDIINNRIIYLKPLTRNMEYYINNKNEILTKLRDPNWGTFVLVVECVYYREIDMGIYGDTSYFEFDPDIGPICDIVGQVGGFKNINRIKEYISNAVFEQRVIFGEGGEIQFLSFFTGSYKRYRAYK